MNYSYLVSAFAAIVAASSMVRAAEIMDLAQAVEGTGVLPYDDCNGACVQGDGTFCGIDGLCHEFSCDKWYQYGPRNFTGYVDDAPALFCQDIPVTDPGSDEVFYYSVAFRCRSVTPSPIAMGFTRKCTANPSGGPATEFTCYELAVSTDFEPFLAKAESSGLECTDDKYDETGYPKFSYRVVYASQNSGGGGDAVSTAGFNSTSEFDAVRADEGALYSVYKEVKTQPPTAAPTPAPSTSGSVSYSKKRLPISVAVGAFLVSWLVMSSMF